MLKINLFSTQNKIRLYFAPLNTKVGRAKIIQMVTKVNFSSHSILLQLKSIRTVNL